MPLAKVSTDRLTKGVSMSRNERMKIVWVKSENIEMDHTKKPSPTTGKVAAEPSEGVSVSRHKRMILTCVRRLAPIASQSSALPSVFGGS